jgi:mutator protein MutT
MSDPGGQPEKPAAAARPPLIEVAAGLIFRDGRLLLAQRPAGRHLAGLWEFPGGKREPGEGYAACLERELREELGVQVAVGTCVFEQTHAHPERTVRLRFFRCRLVSGEPAGLDGQALAWVARDDLARYRFPPADADLVARLQTDPAFWSDAGCG